MLFCVRLIAVVLSMNFMFVVQAQCTVEAFANEVEILCGDPVTLTAIGEGVTVFEEDFNDGNLDEWVVDPTGTFETNICGSSTPDNSMYLWFGNSANAPRDAITPCLDLRTGGLINWDMRFSGNEGGASCENPDAANEGVYLQYRINNAACNAPGPWQLIQEYQPNGGNDPFRTNWNTYTYPIPNGAKQRYVQIRWVQLNNSNDLISGEPLDHWGIDDVQIQVNNPNGSYTWQHTGVSKPTGDTPDVVPTSNITYTVQYTDGTNTCSASIAVNVIKPTISASADKTDICPGEIVQLDSDNDLREPDPVCGPDANTGCRTAPLIFTGNTGQPITNQGDNFSPPFSTQGVTGRMQYIYTLNELKGIGLIPGKIVELGLFVDFIEDFSSSNKNFADNFAIKIRCTSKNDFNNGAPEGGLTTVYSVPKQTFTLGWNMFQLDQGFNWDGNSNILIDMCFKNNGNTFSEFEFRCNELNANRYIGDGTNGSSQNYCGQAIQWDDVNRPITRFALCEPFNPDFDFVWSPNDGTFNPNVNAKDPQVSPPNTTTYTVTAKIKGAPAGCNVTDNVTVNVQSAPEKPQPTYNVGLCEGDALNLLFGTTALPTGAGYSWTGPGGFTSTAKNPSRAGATPAMNGTYSVVVSSSAGCPSLAGTVEVVVNPAPPAPVLGSNSPLCDGQELKLTSSLAGYKYEWTGPNGFTSNVQNPIRNDAEPQMNGVYSLVIENTSTGCRSLNSNTINVVQRALPDAPPFTANKLTLCPGEDLVLSSNVPGGFLDPNFTFTFFHLQSAWTNVQTAKGAVTATRAGVTAAEAGIYALIIQESGSPCPSDTAFLEINIFDPSAFSATNTGPYCEGDVIQLSVNDAGPGSSYNWTGPGAYTSTIRQATRPAAVVAFSGVYSVAIDNGVCANPFTVNTTVNVTKTPNPGTDGTTTVCVNSSSVNLITVLSTAPDAGGTWSDDDASGKLSGSNFDPSVAGTFHFTYTLAAVGACPEKTSIATVVVEPNPNAGLDGAFTACATNQSIDLFSKLNGTPNTGGVWTNIDGAPGFSPAGTFNPNTATNGAYAFEYTVNSTSGICPSAKAKVTVTIEEKPKAGSPTNTTICNGSSVDLFTLLTGEDAGGTWIDLNSSGGLSGSVFTSSSAGFFRFKYTTLSGSVCPPSESIVSVTVDGKPNPGTSRSTSICEDGGLLNLFNELGGNPEAGGTWTNNDASSGFVVPDSFDPTGLGGNTYNFDYELPGAGVCPAQKSTVTVSVLNEPNSGTAIPTTICHGTIFDLYDALSGYDAGGTWRQVTISGGFENGNFLNSSRISLTNLPRTYDFIYKLEAQGCDVKETTVSITVNKPADAGRDTTRIFCQVFGDVTLIDYLAGTPALGGTWVELNGTTSLDVDKINTTSMNPGVYTYEYTVNSLAPCNNQSAQLEIEILEQPDAGSGGLANICSGDVANLFTLLPQPFSGGGVWTESTDSGGDLNSVSGNYNAANVVQGTYSFVYTIAAQNGCDESKATLQLNITEAPQIVDVRTMCSPDRSTFTVSFDIVNGDASSYSVDQPGSMSGNSFTSEALNSGTIIVFTVSDASGCGTNSVEVDKSCDCTTEGQKTNTTPMKICDATTATAIVTGEFVNDSNDVHKFYLHRGNGYELIDPIDSSATPTFGFDPNTMFYDTVYFISAVVGNDLNGFPDPSDDCFQVSQGTPVQFFEGSQLATSMDKTVLCPGDVANLSLSFVGGKLPYTVNYRENGLPKTFGVYTTDTVISYNPLTDVTLNFSTFSNANGCSYNISKVYVIDVNKAPSATITNGDKQCAGDSPSFFISVAGEGTV